MCPYVVLSIFADLCLANTDFLLGFRLWLSFSFRFQLALRFRRPIILRCLQGLRNERHIAGGIAVDFYVTFLKIRYVFRVPNVSEPVLIAELAKRKNGRAS